MRGLDIGVTQLSLHDILVLIFNFVLGSDHMLMFTHCVVIVIVKSAINDLFHIGLGLS